MRTLAFLATFLCSTAFAQIEVPAETEPYQPIVAKVTTPMPQGAVFSGGWTSAALVKILDVGNGSVHIWAPPGTHQLTYTGYWVHTKTVTFKDGDGNTVTVESYLGSGFIAEEAMFTVLGELPPPEPDPDDDVDPPVDPAPIAVDGLRVLFVVETDRPLPTQEQQAMLNSTQWRTAVGAGNWKVYDPDTIFRNPEKSVWQEALEATSSYGVPRLLVSNRPKGGYVGPLPDNLDALLELVDRWR